MNALPIDHHRVAGVCRRHRIRRLSLFGSQQRGNARPDSDVDLLVEFQPGARPSFFTLAQIEIDLSPLFGGKRVDLRTAPELSRFFRATVVSEAEVQYESG